MSNETGHVLPVGSRVITLGGPQNYVAWREGMGGTVEIVDICVGDERREGRGKRLVSMLKKAVPTDTRLIFAITRSGNLIARQFYEAIGFRQVGLLKAFYKDVVNDGEYGVMYGLDL